MAADPIVDYVLTDHAIRELRRRGLAEQDIDGVLKNPGQRLDVRLGRVVLQSKTLQRELNTWSEFLSMSPVALPR